MKVTGPVNGLDMVRHPIPCPKLLLLRVECHLIILLQRTRFSRRLDRAQLHLYVWLA
jgi:hypothetical protein